LNVQNEKPHGLYFRVFFSKPKGNNWGFFRSNIFGTEVLENGTEVWIFFIYFVKYSFASIVIKKMMKKMEQKFCILEQKFGFLKS